MTSLPAYALFLVPLLDGLALPEVVIVHGLSHALLSMPSAIAVPESGVRTKYSLCLLVI